MPSNKALKLTRSAKAFASAALAADPVFDGREPIRRDGPADRPSDLGETMRVLHSIVMVAGISMSLALSPRIADAAAKDEQTVAGSSFVVKGIVADAKGPLANVTVVLSPIDPKSGMAVTVYSRPTAGGDPGMANPKGKSDGKGAFSVTVARDLFVEAPPCAHECAHWSSDKMSLMVWPEPGKVPALEPTTVALTPSGSTIDVGRITLVPMK